MADIINHIDGGMFDSTEIVETPGGFPRGNKAVDSAFFAKMISSFYSDGVLYGDSFAVTPAGGLSVTVNEGIAWAHGYMAWMSTPYTAVLTAGATYYAVVRLNVTLGEFSLIITDQTSSLPTRTSSVCDLIVAEITVPAGASSISSAMINDSRADRQKCGFVRNAIDALSVAAHSEDSDSLGGEEAAAYVKKSGARMTGALYASADSSGTSLVRNISYGTTVPQSLQSGEIFILISQ